MPRPPEASILNEETVPERQFVKLRFDPRIKESIGSVFLEGHFRPAMNGLNELPDNGLDSRHATQGEPATTIHVARGDDRLSVAVFHEDGMGPDELQALVSLGTTEGKGIGVRGMGAEAAAFYVARDMKVIAKKEGESVEWELDVKGFGDITEEYGGKRVVDPRSVKDVAVGRVETILTRLKLPANELPGGAEMRAAFGKKYRPLLPPADEPASLVRGAENHVSPRKVVDRQGNIVDAYDRVVMVVTHKKKAERVVPEPIPLQEGYDEKLRVVWTEGTDGNPEPIGYWMGEVDRARPDGQKVDSGARVYFDGRLVRAREWFGHDSRHAALRNVVGEVHIDHIRGIKSRLMINKAQGVSTSSPEWQRVSSAMHEEIAPFLDELKAKPLDVDPRLPIALEPILAAARLCADSVLGDMLTDDEVLAEMLGQAIHGVSQGQRRPHPGEEHGGNREKLNIKGKPWDEQDAQTPVTSDADPTIPRKRRGFLSGKIEVRDLGPEVPRSSILESAAGTQEGRRLVLNAGFPTIQDFFELYRKDPDVGKWLLETYTALEIVDHAAEEIGGNNVEIIKRYREEGRYRVGKLMHNDQYLAMVRMRPNASELEKKKKKR